VPRLQAKLATYVRLARSGRAVPRDVLPRILVTLRQPFAGLIGPAMPVVDEPANEQGPGRGNLRYLRRSTRSIDFPSATEMAAAISRSLGERDEDRSYSERGSGRFRCAWGRN